MTDLMEVVDPFATSDSWTPVNLNMLPEQPPIRPELGHIGLVYPGKRHVFSGPPESAKTLAAYIILIQVVRTEATAILIDFEMGGYDARQRLRELGATPDDIARVLYIEPDEPATTERIGRLISRQPVLVVIDAGAGAYNLETLDDNKRTDVGRFAALYTESFWHADIATIVIDHVVKDTETRGKWTIGSERKLGGADVHLGFDTIKPISRGTTGHYKITLHKDRAGYLKRGHLADLELNSDPDTHIIAWQLTEPRPTTGEGGYFRPTHLMEAVSVFLEMRHEPVTRNTIANELGGTKDYILKAITALVIEGFATETDGPNRSKLVTSTRRYREDDPTCNPEKPDTSPVVLGSSTSSSRTTSVSGGSVVRPPYGGDTTRPPTPDHAEQLGWFTQNGHLTDSYYDTIAPDDTDEPNGA